MPTGPTSATARRTILFTGRVQGVGFRFTTETIASGFPVTGTVRNLPDGRVELVAEGNPADLDAFQDTIAARMGANITNISVHRSPSTGEFTGFGIAH